MHNKNSIIIVLFLISIFSVSFALSSLNRLKKMDLEYNEKKAVLVKENLDLKDRIENLETIVKQKTDEFSGLESEKKRIEEQLQVLKSENDQLSEEYAKIQEKYEKIVLEKKSITEQSKELKDKYMALIRKVETLEKNPLVQKIRDAIEKEQNREIKKVLESALQNIELIQSGKAVDLSPIVVVGSEREQRSNLKPGALKSDNGQILSIDKRNNLVVIDLGRKDNIKEGDACVILKDNQEFARGDIISTRYKISAVYINQVKYKNSISGIAVGDKVLIEENPLSNR